MAGQKPVTPDAKALMTLARAPLGTTGRNLAFAELLESAPRNLTGFLKSIVTDRKADLGLRSKAIGALGTKTTPAALDALRASLKLKHPMLRRRAIERLGKVGGEKDLKSLRSLKSDDPATRKTIRAAQIFLSYRHGLGAFRIDAVSRTLSLQGGKTLPIDIEITGGEKAAQMVKLARVPGFALAENPPTEIICGSHRYGMFTTKGMDLRTDLSKVQAIPVVVTEENIETGLFEPMYFVLTDPMGWGKFRITLVRPSGRLILAGTGTQGDDGTHFSLEAAADGLHPPTSVSGHVGKEGAPVLHSILSQKRLDKAQAKRVLKPKIQARPMGVSRP